MSLKVLSWAIWLFFVWVVFMGSDDRAATLSQLTLALRDLPEPIASIPLSILFALPFAICLLAWLILRLKESKSNQE